MTFTSLQACRAIAAIMVVFFHAHTFFIPQKLYPGQVVSPVFNIGYAGVEFFFVLSGFIMVLIHRKDMDVPTRAGNFLRKRVVRIYPFYWVVLALLVAAYNVMPSFGPENARDPLIIVTSFLLVPNGDDFIIHAAWTLSHEMLFYFVFTVLILNLRVGAILFAAWMVGIGLAVAAGAPPFPLSFLFSYYNLLFPIGMLVAVSYRHVPVPAALAMTVIGVLGFLAVGLLDVYGAWSWGFPARTLSYGVGAGLAVCGLARLEMAGRISAPRALVFLGDASYSIYLVHGPTLAVLGFLVGRLGLNHMMPASAMLLLLVIVATIGGVVAHLVLERPLLAFFGRGGARRETLKTVP